MINALTTIKDKLHTLRIGLSYVTIMSKREGSVPVPLVESITSMRNDITVLDDKIAELTQELDDKNRLIEHLRNQLDDNYYYNTLNMGGTR